MTVYAIFLCMSALHGCQRAEPGRFDLGDWMPAVVYKSLSDCQAAIQRQYTPGIAPDETGRFPFQRGMWYECRSRHVDTWERP